MKNRLIFLAKSKTDLENISDWLKISLSAEYALNFVNEIISRISILEEFPDLGKRPPDKWLESNNFRMLIIERYAIIYKHIGEYIYIYRIFDTRTNYVRLFKESEHFKKTLLTDNVTIYPKSK